MYDFVFTHISFHQHEELYRKMRRMLNYMSTSRTPGKETLRRTFNKIKWRSLSHRLQDFSIFSKGGIFNLIVKKK